MRLLPQRHDHDHQGAAQRPIRTRPKTRSAKRCATISAAAAPMSKSSARRCAPRAMLLEARGLMAAPESGQRRDRCPSFVLPARARRRLRDLHQDHGRRRESPRSTAMSTSAPASAPRWARSSPKNSTSPLRASWSCSATPRVRRTRARPSPAKPSRSRPCRCARRRRRRGISWSRAPPSGSNCRSRISSIEDGLVRGKDNRSVSYGELIGDETIRLELADDVPVKAVDAYNDRRAIGAARRSAGQGDRRTRLCPRRARARHAAWPRGAPALCRRRCRPVRRHQPDRRRRKLGARYPRASSPSSRIGDFVGVVAEREENAIKAAERLKVSWKPVPTLPDLDDSRKRCAPIPRQPRTLIDKGDVESAIAGAAQADPAHLYLALSDARLDRAVLRRRRLPRRRHPRLVRHAKPAHPARRSRAAARAAGQRDRGDPAWKRPAATAATAPTTSRADALLLSRAVGRPVRVQLTREQEHAWEPKGTAQLMDVNGGLNADGSVAAYDFATRYPSNGAPTLALLLTGRIAPTPAVFEDGRPHRDPALRLRPHARGRQRHAADRARVLVSRRLGAAQHLCA